MDATGLSQVLGNREHHTLGRRHEAPTRERQIDREDADADGSEGHQAELEMAARQPFAQHRARADTDTEGGETEGDDRFAPTQNILGEVWQQ